jgi:hypothetical protein
MNDIESTLVLAAFAVLVIAPLSVAILMIPAIIIGGIPILFEWLCNKVTGQESARACQERKLEEWFQNNP